MKKVLLAVLFAVTGFFTVHAQDQDWFAEKFPEKLINAKGKEVDTATALKGKIVAVYFSASWCPPCRGFTPQLVKFYKSVAKKGNLELVFVSWDKEEKAMKNYMKTYKMPWLAMPYDAQERTQMGKTMRVNGIPRLVIFDSTGKILSSNGRWDVVILGNKALKAWQSPDYKAKTYEDYKGKKGKSSKRKRK